jgi:DDE superfamily endonuclease
MIISLASYRQELYDLFPRRADALMDLLDALSGNTAARSVVALSLNAPFRMEYGSVYTAIHAFLPLGEPPWGPAARTAYEQQLRRLLGPYLPSPRQRPFWLLGVDVTPAPRPFADCLADRRFVHQPNTIRGNKPIAIGHAYSALVVLPEKETPQAPPWVVPLSMRRVSSEETDTQVGVDQVQAVLDDESLPFSDALCVTVGDAAYSARSFVGPLAGQESLVTMARLRGDRVLYRPAVPPEEGTAPPGHPTWYGARFDLKDETTWGPPDEETQVDYMTPRGRRYRVHLQGWHSLLMRGSREHPMHRHPFTVVRARVFNGRGELVFQRPMWLLALGPRREELSLLDIWQAYRQRFDLEHFFRFGKQRLLMNAYQTPNVDYEENWWQIVSLAYTQLWLARSRAETLLRPWERYLPRPEAGIASPAQVQRDFGRIISQLGTPAQVPKPRGYSPGRKRGDQPEGRPRQPVIKKAAKPSPKIQKADKAA